MSMPEKKDSIFKPETDEVKVVETSIEAPEEDAPVEETEASVPTVKVQLTEDYDGPEPVYVSIPGHDRIELPAEVPVTDVDSFVSLPYVEVEPTDDEETE